MISGGNAHKKRTLERPFLLIEESCKNYGKQGSKQAANQDFADPVSEALLEVGKFSFIHRKLLDEHIKIASLVSHIHPKPNRIINDDNCQNDRNGKCAAADAVAIKHGH